MFTTYHLRQLKLGVLSFLSYTIVVGHNGDAGGDRISFSATKRRP